MSINKVFISGNVVADCEKKKAGETPCIEFTLAVNEYRKNKTNEYDTYANFIDCTMFGKRAQAISDYITKGVKVCVEGSLRQSRWEKEGEKRSKVSVIAYEIEIFRPKAEKDEQIEIPW